MVMTKPSSTSLPSAWNVPHNKVVPDGPIILSEQTWCKEHYFNQGNLNYL